MASDCFKASETGVETYPFLIGNVPEALIRVISICASPTLPSNFAVAPHTLRQFLLDRYHHFHSYQACLGEHLLKPVSAFLCMFLCRGNSHS